MFRWIRRLIAAGTYISDIIIPLPSHISCKKFTSALPVVQYGGDVLHLHNILWINKFIMVGKCHEGIFFRDFGDVNRYGVSPNFRFIGE